jgi:fatty acid synthase
MPPEQALSCAQGGPPAPARRLWLTGTLRSNAGLLGLVRCARAEPHGEVLRCVFDASTRHSLCAAARAGAADASADVAEDAELAAALARARVLDLAYNVFRDGRHGCFRSVPLLVPARLLLIVFILCKVWKQQGPHRRW